MKIVVGVLSTLVLWTSAVSVEEEAQTGHLSPKSVFDEHYHYTPQQFREQGG